MNPAYLTAPYEIGIRKMEDGTWASVIFKRGDLSIKTVAPFALWTGELGPKPGDVLTFRYPIRLDENGYVSPSMIKS